MRGVSPSAAGVPPGWPASVPPAGVAGWEQAARAWLLDLCPPDYRAHPVLLRHLPSLAWLAEHHVRAQAEAGRWCLARLRDEMRGVLPPAAMEDTITALESESARLMAAARGVGLLRQALARSQPEPI